MLKLKHIYFKWSLIVFTLFFILISLEVYFFKDFKTFMIVFSLSFVGFLVIFYFSFMKITTFLQDEIEKIMVALKNLTKKKKNSYVNSTYSEEFREIKKFISKLSNILIKQDIQKSIYTNKLELSNTQKDEIISAISHEFKNPIAVINGYSQTLLNDDNLPKTLRKKFLLKIYKNGEKLTNLIDTLRLAVKLDEKKQKLNFKEVDIYQLTNEIIEDIKDSYDRDIKVFGKSVKIKADEILLGVAIRNLIENGIKYSENEILVIINSSFISIIDKGIGIKKEDIDKITEKFYRVTNNSWNNSLGLGLSIVNNIVKLHNFKLEIKSELNEGSEFIIKF